MGTGWDWGVGEVQVQVQGGGREREGMVGRVGLPKWSGQARSSQVRSGRVGSGQETGHGLSLSFLFSLSLSHVRSLFRPSLSRSELRAVLHRAVLFRLNSNAASGAVDWQ